MNFIAFLFYVYLACIISSSAYKFVDVSIYSGLKRASGKTTKYGGPSIADLDGDGYPDIIMVHHDSKPLDVYYNNRNGTFRRSKFYFYRDIHGLNPFHATPYSRAMNFIISVGGANGNSPHPPIMVQTSRDRQVKEEKKLNIVAGRGRSSITLSLQMSKPGSTDVMIFNYLHQKTNKQSSHYAFAIKSKTEVQYNTLLGVNGLAGSYGTVTDVDGDGRMEVVTFHHLQVLKLVSNFRLKNISDKVFEGLNFKERDISGVNAVAELDYDNDGKMDLYITRSGTGDVGWIRPFLPSSPSDILLRNVGGKYQDVTKSAKITVNGESRGVTTGDFNNDGYIDLLVTQFIGPDKLLLNNGDGTFKTVNPGYYKSKTTRGDQPVAVDYNRDGKLDIILGEGDWHKKQNGGFLRILQNRGSKLGNWLLVRVGRSPKGTATSLHALVTVSTSNNSSMIRRVGSPGTMASSSYIELVHFGLGTYTKALTVTVRWTDGGTRTLKNVKANKLVTLGAI